MFRRVLGYHVIYDSYQRCTWGFNTRTTKRYWKTKKTINEIRIICEGPQSLTTAPHLGTDRSISYNHVVKYGIKFRAALLKNLNDDFHG
jgi:hypothetical protein